MTISIGSWKNSEFTEEQKKRSIGYQGVTGTGAFEGQALTYGKEGDGSTTASGQAAANMKYANTLDGERPSDTTLRYPNDTYLGVDTDYVFFQFGKYNPPFGKQYKKQDGEFIEELKRGQGDKSNTYDLYQDSTNLEIKGPSIILPMPQDLGNEISQTWQGKQFSGVGRAAIASLAGANMSFTNKKLKDASGNWKAFQTALTKSALNNLPGIGGNLSFNDISGSTRGIVMNPNTELLYDSPQLREIGMTWKLVPKTLAEAREIKAIIDAFREASLPSYGSSDDPIGSWGEPAKNGRGGIGTDRTRTGGTNASSDTMVFSEENFIHVPWMCKFTFMKGNETHYNVAQFKPCAISKVRVSYTPDGMYSTYVDGSPVATELSINFIESKLIFKGEVSKGF